MGSCLMLASVHSTYDEHILEPAKNISHIRQSQFLYLSGMTEPLPAF
jgi:hypothetical protein